MWQKYGIGWGIILTFAIGTDAIRFQMTPRKYLPDGAIWLNMPAYVE